MCQLVRKDSFKLVGQKLPLKPEQIWAIRIRLQLANNLRDLAMFNLALDSKLRACDLIKLKVKDIAHGSTIQSRAILIQQKTQKPVQFELTQKTRTSLVEWINFKKLRNTDFLFESRVRAIQLLLGHSKLESTVRYLGIEVDDALEISEQTDI